MNTLIVNKCGKAKMKRHSRARRGPPSDPQKPVWDQAAHTLYWAGKAVKHFRALAKYQETLLTAFQQAGWPPCLPVIALDPSASKASTACKRPSAT
jgi:hypothetical protein